MEEVAKLSERELCAQVLKWRDIYLSRIRFDLVDGYDQLLEHVYTAIDEQGFYLTNEKRLAREVVTPVVNRWLDEIAAPLLRDMESDLHGICQNGCCAVDRTVSEVGYEETGSKTMKVEVLLAGASLGLNGARLAFSGMAAVSFPITIGITVASVLGTLAFNAVRRKKNSRIRLRG